MSAPTRAGPVAQPHAPHAGLAPSPWVLRWAALLPAGATVLDVACGSGRHVRVLARQGHEVTGIDRDAAALEPLRACAQTIVADIESGPWPVAGRRFGAVVVTNYLWRPLLPRILDSVAANGLLIYETFAAGNASVGKPSNPDFLLQPGELLAALDAGRPGTGWRVLGYEDGYLDGPPRFVQRIAAVRVEGDAAAARYPL